MANLTKTTRDHDEIRRWAEERGGKPSHVQRTGSGDDIGILRIDFPGYSGEGSLEPISWDQWFEKFDERNLSLLYQEETAGGERSNFNKIVSAETAEEAEEKSHGHSKRSAAGSRASSPTKSGAKKSGAKKSAGKNAAASKKSAGTAGRSSGGAANKTAAKKSAPKKAAKTASKTASSKTASKSAGSKTAAKRPSNTAAKKTTGKSTKKSPAKKTAAKKKR